MDHSIITPYDSPDSSDSSDSPNLPGLKRTWRADGHGIVAIDEELGTLAICPDGNIYSIKRGKYVIRWKFEKSRAVCISSYTSNIGVVLENGSVFTKRIDGNLLQIRDINNAVGINMFELGGYIVLGDGTVTIVQYHYGYAALIKMTIIEPHFITAVSSNPDGDTIFLCDDGKIGTFESADMMDAESEFNIVEGIENATHISANSVVLADGRIQHIKDVNDDGTRPKYITGINNAVACMFVMDDDGIVICQDGSILKVKWKGKSFVRTCTKNIKNAVHATYDGEGKYIISHYDGTISIMANGKRKRIEKFTKLDLSDQGKTPIYL